MLRSLAVGRLAVNLSVLSPRSTGVNTYAEAIAPELQPLDPTYLSAGPVLGPRRWARLPAELSASGGRRSHLLRLAWTQFALPLELRRLGAELLFSPVPEAPVSSRVRYVVTLHDSIPLRFPRPLSNLTLYYRSALPLVLRQALHVIANSQATAREAVELFGVPDSRVTAIPLGYDRRRFYDRRLPRGRDLVFLGRRDPHKNLPVLLRALAGLGECDGLRLRLVGPGSPAVDAHLRALIGDLGLTERVELGAYLSSDELPLVLSRALALALPSLWEGFGLPALEAMACGTPVIASRAGALPEVVGESALLVDPQDIRGWAEAIRTLAGSPTTCRQLGDAGLARAAAFSWERAGAATRGILQRYL